MFIKSKIYLYYVIYWEFGDEWESFKSIIGLFVKVALVGILLASIYSGGDKNWWLEKI